MAFLDVLLVVYLVDGVYYRKTSVVALLSILKRLLLGYPLLLRLVFAFPRHCLFLGSVDIFLSGKLPKHIIAGILMNGFYLGLRLVAIAKGLACR